MQLKKIVVKVGERELNQVKSVLKSFKESKQDATISSLRHGSLGDDTLVSFNVEEQYYNYLVEKLTLFGIKVLRPISKTEKDKVQVMVKQKLNVSNYNHTGSNKSVKETPASILDGSIERGDYEKLIQMSKDFRSGHELIKKAKDNIENTVISAINSAYDKALKSKFEINTSFNQLIKIASDKNLKVMNLINHQKSAGFYAVKICAAYREYINLLIQICNNNAIPNIVCVKAAVELSNMVLLDENEDIEYAVRYLNVKWLQIAFDIAGNEISQQEKDSVRELITNVRKIRNIRIQ